MTNPNDPAFVITEIELENGTFKDLCGLTKREYFAGLAMETAYLFARDADPSNRFIDPKDLAMSAVAYADALISELNKRNESH